MNVKAKTSFQPSSKMKNINSKYPKFFKPIKKDKTNKNNRNYQDKDKNKSIQNPAITNTHLLQA